MIIKSFRGLLTDGQQQQINLSHNDGRTGYKIVKMQIMHAEPGQQDAEHTFKVYSKEQATIDNAINFSDNTLLAAAYLTDDKNTLGTTSTVIVFDNSIFNQDIYVTHSDTTGSQPANYYIELEQFPLDLSESTVVTLQNIRDIGV
jgi:hypothetical protein